MTGSLMIQGTTSNAGKSVLVTGLCRLLHRNGIRVAPFKPQNMALNSAVTVDGGEIGRSQAVQAIAAGVEPHTDMNPVLLKPNTDQGAQVIINGRAIGNMNAREYHAFKSEALPHALAAYDRLMEQYDLVITEGAGSPAEINLRENDVANMGFALARNVPVIIVADIDRGGVFAHLKGTMDCLSEEERALVKGFVINRFRGDVSLLTSGNEWLERETGAPVLGVLPYVHGLHIEAEDAVNTEQVGLSDEGPILNVIVPRMPRISNHTDFDVLRLSPRVNLQFIGQGEEIPGADLVILPGSKSTIGDLKWLYSNGWKDYLLKHVRYGGKVIGICGGYQMLGNVIHDPDGIEGSPGSLEGLGLLDVETVLEPEKQLKRVSGTLNKDGAEVTGYEIHIGTTSGPGAESPLVDLGNHADGAVSPDGQVMGTYLHGLFDATNAAESLMRWAGLDEFETADYDAIRQREFDRVADMLETEISLETLKQCAGLA